MAAQLVDESFLSAAQEEKDVEDVGKCLLIDAVGGSCTEVIEWAAFIVERGWDCRSSAGQVFIGQDLYYAAAYDASYRWLASPNNINIDLA